MFAGAAREAVFSRADVIERINDDFVPVAVKAGLVANPPPGPEGRLYAELRRTQPAPQGIGVLDSQGRVLQWALSFDDEASVTAFLDDGVQAFRAPPDATRRYMRYPGRRLDDVPFGALDVELPARHGTQGCPADHRVAAGTLIAKLVGRSLDADGTLCARTSEQEHYVEDLVDVPPQVQAEFARAVASADAGGDANADPDAVDHRVRVPDTFVELLAQSAYLGQLDVAPQRAAGGTVRGQLWAQRVHGDGPGWVRIYGTTQASGDTSGRRGDGAGFHHEIVLAWHGFAHLDESRITRLVLAAHGREKLQWTNPMFARARGSDVSHLMAGTPIDIDVEVRYGLVGAPANPAQIGAADDPRFGTGARQRPPGREGLGANAGLQRKLRRLIRRVQELAARGEADRAETAIDTVLELLGR